MFMRRSLLIKLMLSCILPICLNLMPLRVLAETDEVQQILIIQLQTASEDSKKDQFVTLFNPNSQSIDVTGWELQYRGPKSSDDKAWKVKAKINCELDDQEANDNCRVEIAARDKLWLASYDLGADRPSHDLKTGLGQRQRGGQIRFVKPSDDQDSPNIQDVICYGSAKTDVRHLASVPKKGQILERKQDDSGNFVNSGDNSADFKIAGEDKVQVEPPPADSSPTDQTKDSKTIYPKIEITELLPHPETNSADKFIELFNPNDQPVSLEGYKLQTGIGWKHSHALSGLEIQAHSYAALRFGETHLPLIYKTGAARLLDPNGEVVDQTQTYQSAKIGQAWAKTESGSWQWTTTPTPGEANKITSPSQETTASLDSPKPKKVRKEKIDKTKSSDILRVKVAKATKDKVPKKDKAAKDKAKDKKNSQSIQPLVQPAQIPNKPNGNFWFISAAASIAGGYGAYEYRQELYNVVRKIREKFTRGGGS